MTDKPIHVHVHVHRGRWRRYYGFRPEDRLWAAGGVAALFTYKVIYAWPLWGSVGLASVILFVGWLVWFMSRPSRRDRREYAEQVARAAEQP